MAESLSNASGVVALATFAFQSSTILYTAVRDLQSQDKNARALENELADLRGVLQSLEAVSDNPDMNLEALRFPLYRCGKACEEYGDLIARCTKRSNASRPSMRDWISQQYLRGDISDFREMIAGYRATISIALANANMRIVSIPADVLGDYKDFISDTTRDLQAHLQRLEEKEQDLAASKDESSFPDAPGWPAMLEEIESTQQCLRICSQLATQIVKLESTSKGHPPFSQQPSAYKHLGSGVGAAKSSLYSIGLRLENLEKDIDKRMGAMKSILPLSEPESSQLAQLQETKENLRQCLNIVLQARETFTGEQRDRYDGLEQMSTDGAGSSEPDTIFSKSYSDGSTVSSVSALGFTAEEQLVEMFMNHDAFQLLLQRVSKIIKPHEIERHVHHLLHYYGKDLRREAETLAQAAAADFVRRSARRVAIRICASTQNSAHNSIENSPRGKPLRTELLRRYLESLAPTGTFANGPNADEETNVVEPDGSDDDEPQNLEEVHSFLLSSQAFALLCHSMRVWLKQHEEVPIRTSHEDVPESRNPQYNQSRLRHMSSTLAWIWFQASSFVLQTLRPVMSAAEGARVLWEPRVSTNQERLRWRCSCGKMLYGDFDKMNSQAVRELAKSLKTLSSTKSSGTSVSQSCATPSAMEIQVSSPVKLPPSDTGATSNSSRNLSRNLNSRHDGPMDSLTETPIPNLQGQCQPLRRTFFEVCVNSGEYAVRLGEIDITTVRSDAELFSKIWTTYDSMKRNWPKRILLKPRGVHFVYFGVRHRYQAGIYKGPLEIPPMSEVTSERYSYYECPLKVLPPMPAGVFLHYLSCAKRKNWTCEVPEAHAEGFFLQRLPKKIHRSIIDELGTCNTFESSNGIAFGWGVHIIEGPDHGTLSLVLGLGILLSLVISLMVCGIAGTQEQGFGIGQFLLAVLACMMGALYFKLQEL